MITVVRRGMPRKLGTVREYVGRPGPLGNPYSHLNGPNGTILVATRQEAVDKYRDWLWNEIQKPYASSLARRELRRLYLEVLGEGIDLELECWCTPQACHADVVKEFLEGMKI